MARLRRRGQIGQHRAAHAASVNRCLSSRSRGSSGQRASLSAVSWPTGYDAEFLDRAIVAQVALRSGIPESELETYDERLPSFWQRVASALERRAHPSLRCRRCPTASKLPQLADARSARRDHPGSHRGSGRARQRGDRRPWRRVHPRRRPGTGPRPAPRVARRAHSLPDVTRRGDPGRGAAGGEVAARAVRSRSTRREPTTSAACSASTGSMRANYDLAARHGPSRRRDATVDVIEVAAERRVRADE